MAAPAAGEGEPARKYHCALLGTAPFPFQPRAGAYLARVPFCSALSLRAPGRVRSGARWAVAREAGALGTGHRGSWANQARGMRAGSKGSHIRQQASRSLLTTPNPPLRLEHPFFPQRPLVFHHSGPVSSSAFPLSCHSSFLCSS